MMHRNICFNDSLNAIILMEISLSNITPNYESLFRKESIFLNNQGIYNVHYLEFIKYKIG